MIILTRQVDVHVFTILDKGLYRVHKIQSNRYVDLDLRDHQTSGTCRKEENQGLAFCLYLLPS